ncbi:DUF502 domain-containing protein [Natronoglomus mannanivorans]|uniref:DUF502 domain-containing protein n=1 Tax=Natronoglomus mannanivorans TaxID=2979990 RepID=A0AAP2Z120_9EURY|nr:DUF502 domain-containing protein [Halobacteria archaeon AArc-xg1-1]
MAGPSSSLKRWLVNGIAITIPLVVTLLVLLVVLDFILGVLSPVVDAVTYVWPNEPPDEIVQLTTLLSLFGLFLLVGFVAEHTPGEHLSRTVHRTMETIPGISTIYTSVRRASDIIVDDDTTQFQEVKVVEFPHEEAYMLGFVTADSPTAIADSLDTEEMMTIMVPLAPNPATNGFVMYMPAENVHDVDLTVEEAVRAVATLGVASDSVGVDEDTESEPEPEFETETTSR